MSFNSGHWEFYQDSRGEWRWRHTVSGRIVAASTEGYHNRTECVNNARRHGYVG
jgi:uncharacterized protein YegP (UPF0339 family)